MFLRRFGRVAVLATAVSACALAADAAVASASSFTRGYADSVWVYPQNAKQTTAQWARNVYASGGRIAEVEVDWLSYEPSAPAAGSHPASPANRAYSDWADLDKVVKTLAAAHVQSMFMVTEAPSWAQAKGAKLQGETQGYYPNDTALRQFVQALATRYDGHYPNPERKGQSLPKVSYYQDWAEANLTIKLAPQWTKVAGRWVNTGATLYRNMLNSFYAGVKSAVPSDKVVFSGLESYGDPAGTTLGRVSPVTFLENVLCLNGLLQKVCDTPTHFDILASDPYDVGSPTTHAVSSKDASAPDLRRLTKVVSAATKDGTLLPRAGKPLWVTEFGYDSDPPNRAGGLPLAQQARWLEQSLYVFWNEGVSDVFWYLIRDQPGTDYANTYYSGTYFYNGRKKPSYLAYRFPLVVAADGNRSQVWGIAPATGTIRVQEHVGSDWKTVLSFHRSSGAVFSGYVGLKAKGAYRATDGSSTSLIWNY